MAKTKKLKIPKNYEGGEVMYELVTKQTFWPKIKMPKEGQTKKAKPKPMPVKVVNVVKMTSKDNKRKKK